MSFDLPPKIDLKDDSISIHLAGPGFGEGILITVGQKIAIGIDCCFSLVEANQKGEANYLERQISELADESYLFWLISHFHADHIQSFDEVLDLFEDKLAEIIVPHDFTHRDLVANAVYSDTKVTMRKDTLAEVAKTQYEEIRTALCRKSLENKIKPKLSKSTWLKTTLRLSDRRTEVPLEVEVYALTYESLRSFQGKAIKGLAQAKKSSAMANEGSYVLRITAGKFEAFFLGDVHSRRTIEIVDSLKPSNASVMYLKVAHHGSPTGTSQSLLDKFLSFVGEGSERYALIAPFEHNGLPTRRVEEMLAKAGFEIRATGSRPSAEPLPTIIATECGPITNAHIDGAIPVGSHIIVEKIKLEPVRSNS